MRPVRVGGSAAVSSYLFTVLGVEVNMGADNDPHIVEVAECRHVPQLKKEDLDAMEVDLIAEKAYLSSSEATMRDGIIILGG